MNASRPLQISERLSLQPDRLGAPVGCASIDITERRLRSLRASLLQLLKTRVCGPAAAAKLHGQLVFTCTQLYGKLGRSKLAPFRRRQHEARCSWNWQMECACRWWLLFLKDYLPREVPAVIPTRLPVVTYSDGEGTGGIGISIYRRGEAPRAAYMVVHREIRRLWESQLQERTPLE